MGQRASVFESSSPSPDNSRASIVRPSGTTDDEPVDENMTEEECRCCIRRIRRQPDQGTPLPVYVLHNVEHFKQRFNWDCGVACVLMLLGPERRQFFLDHFDTICQSEGFGHSTWTIDLCYLLKRFNIPHTYHSRMMGANEEFRLLKFYAAVFDQDGPRVADRFERAAAAGLTVRRGLLCARALRTHLARHGPAIALLDAPLLACDTCKHNKIFSTLRRIFGGMYMGHYVLVVGYSARGNRLLYRDPGVTSRVCAASARALYRAHTAPGTDHDIILVHRSYNRSWAASDT